MSQNARPFTFRASVPTESRSHLALRSVTNGSNSKNGNDDSSRKDSSSDSSGNIGSSEESDNVRDNDGQPLHRRRRRELADIDGEQDTEQDISEPERQAHHWRSRPPLLPQKMATLVSTLSGATRLSLEITALFWEAVFETISESAGSGRWLGAAAWQEAKSVALAVASVFSPLSSLNPRIVSHVVGTTTAAGYSMFNRSLAATESLVEGSFTLYTKAVNLGLHAAGEYVRLIDAIFGSTDTSRVLASFVHMCRREMLENNPEIRALIKEHGLFGFVSQVLKTVVAWICLQVVTHGRSQPYRLSLVYTNILSGAEFCPRKFISSTGEPLVPPAALSRTPEAMSPATSPWRVSPLRPRRDGPSDSLLAENSAAQNNVACSPSLRYSRTRSATIDTTLGDDIGIAVIDPNDDEDNIQYPFSDQEGASRDSRWNQRLVDALHALPSRSDHRNIAPGDCSSDEEGSMLETAAHAQNSRPSIWSTLNSVREAAAAAAKEHTNDDSSSGESDLSPSMPSISTQDMPFPAFASAPASLISSPQFPTTPDTNPTNRTFRSSSIAQGSELADACATILESIATEQNPAPTALSQPQVQITREDSAQPSTNLLSTIAPLVDPPLQWESQWTQQEFPRKPLLFNLARFISIASSAYGRSFMRVIGMDRGMIDARALIDAFGDIEIEGSDPCAPRLSKAGSHASVNMPEFAAEPLRGHSMSPSSPGRLPRAQPMSTCHENYPARSPSRPGSLRPSLRPSRPETPGARRAAAGRRLYQRRTHLHRRPVAEHPNHFCFSQHTGIPLGDLLFSSYVPPIVPGVTKAASAQASAVERKLRHKRSVSAAKNQARKQQRTDLPGAEGGYGGREMQIDAAAQEAPEAQPSAEVAASASKAASKGWLSSIPVVGTIYRNIPSPMGVLSSVPILPSMVSRALSFGSGGADSTNPSGLGESAASARAEVKSDESANPSNKRKADSSSSKAQREPTPSQFRRFDKIRRRLVYRNPSIHALVHYIAVDHATRAVVLACRGTLGISDLFIDMICEYEAVRLPGHSTAAGANPEFRAHSGMWHSALLLADPSSEVFGEVAEALRLYPEYGLVITGHSLGGGVASLLTLLWSQPMFDNDSSATEYAEMPSSSVPGSIAGTSRQFVTTERFGLVAQRPIHCFSFGSPCSTNAALSYYCRGLVTSVVNTDDFVSFLSVGACVDILNISAVLGRERGVAEKVMRGFLSTQRSKIGKRFSLFDFDFSKLRAYESEEEEEEEEGADFNHEDEAASANSVPDSSVDCSEPISREWSYKTAQSNITGFGLASDSSSDGSSPSPNLKSPSSSKPQESRGDLKQSKKNLDDWHLSLVKTLRANMDSEKLYPPGDVFVLASPGDDEVADRQLPKARNGAKGPAGWKQMLSSQPKDKQKGNGKADEPLPVGLFYCPDVAERFCELRFTRNMIIHHMPSTYERKLSALVHDTLNNSDNPKE
ncbi:hypothetical protein H4R20_000902 [Coemansia guatemalensis]|uniref:sn-1-specific diacylglycerol lipase n=1 Tax=Coemansia guatemalensis TaxID=2761395 RepID=A0A9W8LW73_9FUNG|nr:hypothetical protein H4R20_000902 [Coemansia guatemalensis]